MMQRIVRIAAFALAVPAAGGAWAGELITNGGFESGLTGWTVTSLGSGSCSADWNVGNTGAATNCLNPGNPPTGTNAAYSSFDGPGPLVYRLRQTVVVPSSVTGATLRWAQAVNATYTGQARTFSVNILDTSFNLIGNAYTLSVPTSSFVAAFAPQSANVTALLAANAGRSVVVEFALTVPQAFTGPAGFGLDDVSLLVADPIPTLNEWALISLAALLGLFGILAVRRRKTGVALR